MIEKMKFLSITGPKADIDRMTETYLSKYEIHLENALSELTEVANLSPFLEINPYREALTSINSFYEQLEDPESITPKKMDTETAVSVVRRLQKESGHLADVRQKLKAEHAEMLDSLKIIRPFQNLNYDISEILNFSYIHYRFGRIEKQYFQKFEKYIYDTLDTLFIKCSDNEQYIYGVYFVPKHQAHKVHAVYSSMHFEQIFVPDCYTGTAREAFSKLEQRHKEIHAGLDANQKAADSFLKDNCQDIVSAKAALDACSSSFDIRKLAACTRTRDEVNPFYILCGWMTEKDALAFQEDIRDDDKIFCLMEDEESPAKKTPPTKLHNPKLFRPFEMYVKMYGLPAYNEFDPTLFLTITYAFIFGIMFGDLGQGLCLFIGGAILYKVKKMDLAGIVCAAGVSSCIFGALFGSFFGFEFDSVISPLKSMVTLPFLGEINIVLVAAFLFGSFVILTTMVLNIANAIKQKNLGKALFGPNAVTGFIFYASVIAVILLYMTGKPLPGTVLLIIMFVVPLALIFFEEPLKNLIAKKKPIDESAGIFAATAFFELFDYLITYLSNALSFLRIGVFAISHAAMMEVVMTLAGAENGGMPNILVVIIGNIIVLGMEGLVVGIQVLRLEYYEIFGRFYDGSGREFVPFRKNNK